MRLFDGNRGQGALEYMMTYGWAILIIMIVGVIIWQMGVLEPGTPTKDFRGFSEVKPLDWVLASGGSLQMVLSNDAGTMVDLASVSASFQAGGSGNCNSWSEGFENFRPGAVTTVQLNCGGVEGEVGDYYKVNVSISYTNKASTLQHLSYGVLWGPLE
ncbi:MAG TPA: hypothetical protein ENN13_00410 [Candidatus Altiarchaeales archaeon]|nr:hypothetical protein [Candidatus Altiarchaeales archaeon]